MNRTKNLWKLAVLLGGMIWPLNLPHCRTFAADANLPSGRGANSKDIYHAGWTDFNKNGIKDIFEDPTQPQEKRVENLLS